MDENYFADDYFANDYFFEEEMYEGANALLQQGQFSVVKETAAMDLTLPLYALALVVAFAAGILLMHGLCRKKGLKGTTALNFALLALPLGLVGARVFYVVNRLDMFQEIGLQHITNLWFGGYALWGAIGGGVLAALLCAWLTKQKFSRIMDAAAAPTALVIGLARLAEYFNGEGVGMMIEEKSLQFFPLAVRTVCEMWDGVVEYEEWRLAVFVLEALAAFIILLVLLRTREEDGRQTKVFFILFCTVSLVLESIREDSYLRWQTLFVKVNQLASALTLTGIAVCSMIRRLKKPEKGGLSRSKAVLCSVVYVLLAGVCIGMEFALQKLSWLPNGACYAIMTLSAAGMGVCAWQLIFPRKSV
ncbi:MAG: prolipoprotein diacylglyceryl transferase [Clostridia bacterium]|nr:prolipoprotein diacylglyceryl transferase [Clostridia bacterium]